MDDNDFRFFVWLTGCLTLLAVLSILVIGGRSQETALTYIKAGYVQRHNIGWVKSR